MPVTNASFDGILAPPQVQKLINLLIDQAPFAQSLSRVTTNRRSVAWPTASPTGWSWLAELAPIPEIAMGDDSYIAVMAKLAGIVKVSNESVTDSQINLTASLTTMLRDSLSRDLDLGILNGTGPPQPNGVIPAAPAVTAADLLAGVSEAVGEINDSGGTANTLAVSGATLAAENAKTGPNGLFYPAGFAAAVGLRAVVVPALSVPLVYDSARCYLVQNPTESTVDVSVDAYFAEDATGLRIKARVAAAIPAPAKSIRKITVGAPLAADTSTSAKK